MLIQSYSEPRSGWSWRDELVADDAEAFEGHLVLRRARVVRGRRVADQVRRELCGRCFRILGAQHTSRIHRHEGVGEVSGDSFHLCL